MTEAELEKLEEQELEETEKSTAEILALYVLLWAAMKQDLAAFFGMYAVDGRLNWEIATRRLNSKELSEFNSTNGTSYKRLTRMGAFLHTLSGRVSALESGYIDDMTSLAERIFKIELDAFNVNLDDLDDIIKTPWGLDELYFGDRIKINCDKLRAQLASEVKQKIASGAKYEDVIADVERRIEIAKRAAKNSILTESSALNTIARHEIFKSLGVTKWKYYAQRDERTCEVCGSMHGKTFLINAFEIGVTAPPLHRNCRCWCEMLVD